jgi:hypothetical protein
MIKYGWNIGKMPISRMFNKIVLALAIFLSIIGFSGCAGKIQNYHKFRINLLHVSG